MAVGLTGGLGLDDCRRSQCSAVFLEVSLCHLSFANLKLPFILMCEAIPVYSHLWFTCIPCLSVCLSVCLGSRTFVRAFYKKIVVSELARYFLVMQKGREINIEQSLVAIRQLYRSVASMRNVATPKCTREDTTYCIRVWEE